MSLVVQVYVSFAFFDERKQFVFYGVTNGIVSRKTRIICSNVHFSDKTGLGAILQTNCLHKYVLFT